MTGFLQVFCGLLIAGAVLAFAVLVSRRSHGGEPRASGTAAVPPARGRAAASMAAPAVTVQPRGEITGPYGYDNGITSGGPS